MLGWVQAEAAGGGMGRESAGARALTRNLMVWTGVCSGMNRVTEAGFGRGNAIYQMAQGYSVV